MQQVDEKINLNHSQEVKQDIVSVPILKESDIHHNYAEKDDVARDVVSHTSQVSKESLRKRDQKLQEKTYNKIL